MTKKNHFLLLPILLVPILFIFIAQAHATTITPLEHRSGFTSIGNDNLSDLADLSGTIGDYFKLKYADKLIRDRQFRSAQKIADKVNHPILTLWQNVILSEVALEEGDFTRVLSLTTPLPATPRPEFSFGESAYRDLVERFLNVRIKALQAKHQSSDTAAGALSVITWDGSTSHPTTLTTKQKTDLLHRLHFTYQYKKVPGLITTSEIILSSLGPIRKCRALYELGNSLRRSGGETENSLTAFTTLAKSHCSPSLTAKALYWSGSLALSIKNENLAGEALTELVRKFPNHRLADDALYLLQRHYQKTNNAPLAKKYATQLLQLKSGDMKNDYIFDAAFAEYKKNRYQKAITLFSDTVNSTPTSDETYPRAVYWQARAYEKTQLKETTNKAKLAYKRIVNDFPFSYYAVLAANRLGVGVKIPTLPILTGTAPANSDAYFALIDSLNHKGFHDEASHMLDLALHAHPRWMHQAPEYITRKFIESQNYRKALDMATRHFDHGVYGPTQVSNAALFAAFYPRIYLPQVNYAYQQTGLPKGCIEGITREESLFQKNVKSWVGATGLMQLMPTTAQFLRRKIPGGDNLTDLTDPQTNIILGATYLQQMRVLFNNQLPYAIMAYNAGPGNVQKWLRNTQMHDLDEFIEDIPFSETRGYVKRVLRSMQVYGGLYQDPFFKKPFFSFDVRAAQK